MPQVLAEQLVPYSIMAVRILYGNFLVDLNALYQPCATPLLHTAACTAQTLHSMGQSCRARMLLCQLIASMISYPHDV